VNEPVEDRSMDHSRLAELISPQLEQKGYRARVVSLQHLADLTSEIESLREEGAFEEVFYQERLTCFDYALPAQLPAARSLIITAAPQPQQRVGFKLKGKPYHITVPPTYSSDTDRAVESALSAILQPEGFSLHPARVPEKLLAVCSGLARYGKNNIAYVEGMGSFHRLEAFFSDLPALEDTWVGLQAMEQCHKCTACISKCPTGSIVPDRFLILAERCLTFHNERSAEFPQWIDPSWHNCLIGCMACQLACPVNKGFFDWFDEGVSFTEEETALLLRGVPGGQLPQGAARKLEKLGLLEDVELVTRNLAALLKQRSA
jgi:epoxyqueuosine reductase